MCDCLGHYNWNISALKNNTFVVFQFMDLIELCEKEPSLENLLGSFNNQNVSDYVVVYLRLLTSGYLQREHIFFQHFIEGVRSVKEFCQQVGV